MNFVRMPLYKAIFDTRFGASQAFGAASARMGTRTVGIEDDVTVLWFHEFGPHWSAGRQPNRLCECLDGVQARCR